MKKFALLIICYFVFNSYSIAAVYSFYEIKSSGEYIHNKSIEIVGVLSIVKQKEGNKDFYLCSSMDACFSVSKDRLKLELPLNYDNNIDLDSLDLCHVSVSVSGVYKYESSTDLSRSFGRLTEISNIAFGVARNDYVLVNSNRTLF